MRLLEQTHSLQMAAKEHELRFGTLNEKRANILAEIYEALYDTFRGIRILTASIDFDDESETKKKVDYVNSHNHKFDQAFSRQRIYLPKDLADALENIHSSIKSESLSYYANWLQAKHKLSELSPDEGIDLEGQAIKNWRQNFTNVNGAIKGALDNLENEMRKLLGAEC